MNEKDNSEDRKVLFVRGICEDVDEEILFELFQNAGPLKKVTIPLDNVTKRKKTFGFIHFHHEESVPYAIDLFRDIRLFGRSLQMQNKTTGAGMSNQNRNNQQQNHQRTMSAPVPQQIRGQNQAFIPPFANMPNNQQVLQQQFLMAQQHQFQQQRHFDRQFSDNSSYYQQQRHQGQERRHHSHDRDDRHNQHGRNQHHRGHDYRDRSHDRSRDNHHSRRRR